MAGAITGAYLGIQVSADQICCGSVFYDPVPNKFPTHVRYRVMSGKFVSVFLSVVNPNPH
jgi:hypothetical protein